ncbi:MAG: carbohydrate kinase family protein [Patescibacteria group bacterium]|nr:carbohydrate kinase family protein [Patescibacteria group bacterium]
MYDVITIGSATRDVFIRSDALEIKKDRESPTGLDSCFPLGAKIDIKEMVFETGGGATNAAVTFARLGHSAAVIAAVGEDDNARSVGAALKAERISAGLLQTKRGEQTAFSVILLSGTGERTILVHRGAAEKVSSRFVPWTTLETRWFYVSSLGGNLKLVEDIAKCAHRINARIAWNPGNKELKHGLKRLKRLIRHVDVFNLNLEEAAALLGQKGRDPKLLLSGLAGLPRRAAIITDGANGAYAAERGAAWHSGALKVKHINMTGAGDAFGSGLVAGLLKKDDLPYALSVGTCNAAGVVQHMGAKVGLLRHFPSVTMLRRVRVKRLVA